MRYTTVKTIEKALLTSGLSVGWFGGNVKGTECRYGESTIQQNRVNRWATSNRGRVLREGERTRVGEGTKEMCDGASGMANIPRGR